MIYFLNNTIKPNQSLLYHDVLMIYFRIYPITFATSRHIEEDLEIGGYMIPAGVCSLFLYYVSVNTTGFVI